jgi:hypothetical protein
LAEADFGSSFDVGRISVSQFEYAAVLVSIIVGLALTQILRGVGRIVTSPNGPSPYWVHLVWTLWLFIFTTGFWWFEINLRDVTWNISIYNVWIIYATLIFFTSLIVQPSDLTGISSYKEYYYRNRGWFFGLVIAFSLWDFVDTFVKGVSHFSELGVQYPATMMTKIVGSAIAMSTKNERYHQVFAVLVLLIDIANNYSFFFTIE